MDLTPYYQGADRRLFQQVNPSLAGMPEREGARQIESMEEATSAIIKNMGDRVEKMDEITNKGNLSSGENEKDELIGQYKEFVAKNPFAFKEHEKLADKLAGKIRGINREFTNDEYSSHFESWKESAAAKFLINSSEGVIDGKLRAGKQSWEARINSQMARGDYAGAAETRRAGGGTFEPAEAAEEGAKTIDLMANTKRIENLCYQDPMTVIKSINSGELDGNYTPEEQEKFFQLADQNASKRDIILNTPNKGRVGGIVAAASGEFSKGEIDLEDGKARTGRYDIDDARSLASEEAMAAPAIKDGTPEMEQWAERFYNKYERYGLKRENLNGLVKIVRARFDRKTPEWNPKDAADVLQSNNWFNSAGLWVNEKPADSIGRGGRQVDASGKVYKTDDFDFPGYEGNKEKVLIELAKNEAKENRRKTDEAFNAWKLTEAGKNASLVAQQKEYIDIASKIVGKKIPFDFQPAADIDARINTAIKAENGKQDEKFTQWKGSQIENKESAQNVFQNVAIGIEQTATPGNGIIVPKAMMPKDAKEGMMACIEIGKDKYVRIPIVGTTDGGEAMFTQDTAASMRMRRGGRVLGSRIQIRAKDGEEKKYYPEIDLTVPNYTSDGMPGYDPSDPNEIGLNPVLPPWSAEAAAPISQVNNQ